MPKFYRAADLLKEKNYVENKFDQEGFSELIYNFFKENDIKEKIILVPKRFIEMYNPPKCGYIDKLRNTQWMLEMSWEDLLIMRSKGKIVPTIFVDTPFLKNAASMLEIMNGFIVRKLPKGQYEVTLV